jgi:hypothetical protein
MVSFGGVRIVIVEDTVETIKRSWRERLFSTPWTPLVKVRHITSNPLQGKEVVMDKENNVMFMTQRSYDHILGVLPPHPKTH